MARPKTDFTNIKCCICEKGGLTSKTARRGEYINEQFRWKWTCINCYRNNFGKVNGPEWLADYKIGNLDPKSSRGKGYILEQITCKRRIVKNLNIASGNFEVPIDHSRDSELGIIQTKGATFNSNRKCWSGNFYNEHGKKFDYLIFYCMDKDMKNVLRVYIIPWKEIMIRNSIEISAKVSGRSRWYDSYRIDEDSYNDVYHNMHMDDCPVLRKANNKIPELLV